MTESYRPAAGIMLVNDEGLVWVGQRLDNAADAWQMPQGGLDPGEDPQVAAMRELEEETGIPRQLIEVIAAAPEPLFYDFPPALAAKLWGGRYKGQRQHWFLCRFLGRDEDVNIATAHPEFRAWRWVEPAALPELIVPFKRRLYEDVVRAFEGLI
jgi:putative (di)nucleoside polyphosphate hydrolase